MDSLDERLGQLKYVTEDNAEPNAEGSQPATDEPKGDEVSPVGNEGSTDGDNKPSTDADKSAESLPADKKADVAKPTYSKREKARYAFAKLTSKNSDLKNKLKMALDCVENFKGVKYDPNTMKLEEYLTIHDDLRKAQGIADKLQKQVSSDVPNELRVAQAEAVWDGNDKALADYNANVLPHIAEINRVLTETNPIVARYLRSSENAPLLESAFVSDKGKQWLAYVNTNDSQATWDRCRQMERELMKEAEGMVVNEQPKMPSRATTSATKVGGSGASGGNTVPTYTMERVRKMMNS